MIQLPPTVTASGHDEGLRIDQWFKRNIPSLPYGLVQKFLRCGMIRVQGQKVDATYRLQKGDIIKMPPQKTSVVPSESHKSKSLSHVRDQDLKDFDRWVVYEDEQLAVINKPNGLAVQGGSRTLIHLDGLLQKRAQIQGHNRWLLVHRLDKDTSGLLVVAKSPKMAHQLTYGFQKGWIPKTYWGITVGIPREREGSIRLPLMKKPDEENREKVTIHKEGDQAVTQYVMLDRAGTFAWLRLKPLTGRTHQLRVHCASMGTPLLGDGKYGGAAAHPLGRTTLHLHARHIDLSAVLGRPLMITAPLSPSMLSTFDQFGFHEPDGDEQNVRSKI